MKVETGVRPRWVKTPVIAARRKLQINVFVDLGWGTLDVLRKINARFAEAVPRNAT
jgi:hypothetical protein